MPEENEKKVEGTAAADGAGTRTPDGHDGTAAGGTGEDGGEKDSAAPGTGRIIGLLVGIAAAAVMAVLLVFFLAFRSVTKNMSRMMQETPADFEALEWEQDEADGLKDRIETARREGTTVELSERDLSLLLSDLVRREGGEGSKAMVKIGASGRLSASISQPADVEGRKLWLNLTVTAVPVMVPGDGNGGTGDGDAETQTGTLVLEYKSIRAGDVDLAGWLDLDVKGEAGAASPGALLESVLPGGVNGFSISLAGTLVLNFGSGAEGRREADAAADAAE
ncbi:MAG: hypothetical protein JW909_07860 [Planctomycetes bacterium]|nr:hypothetical protein [Planctomycetota bacterium]